MRYDISNYRSIHAPYGTVEDVQKLIDDLRSRKMRLLMHLVVNHTSDEHAWFIESRSSRTNTKRDWYFWRDPIYDANGNRKEPNNWKSIFGGSAWHFDERTEQYCLALFLPRQPDLNWANAEMREAAYNDIVDIDFGPNGKYDRDDFHLRKIRKITNTWQTTIPKFNGWNSVYLDNHDSGRALSRYASDAPEHRAMAAKMLATYLTTLGGTPFMLAGQEIGMANLGKDYGAEAYIDVEGKNYYNAVLDARGGDELQMKDVMRELQLKARDHGRLPVQWDDSPNAGFTAADAKPWMTINKDYTEWNVKSQVDDVDSVLSYWKRMQTFRKKHADVLAYGSYEGIPEWETGEMVLGYRRVCHTTGETLVMLLNFSDTEQRVDVKQDRGLAALVGNQELRRGPDRPILLVPFGAVVLGPE
jgi:alpha-glucosidase